MVALMAVIAHATAQDLDEKYATDLLKAGTEAPDMRVGTGKDGKAVRLSDLKGKYVLINFWASWCPDCRRETPALQRLWQKYGEKVVIEVNKAMPCTDKSNTASTIGFCHVITSFA